VKSWVCQLFLLMKELDSNLKKRRNQMIMVIGVASVPIKLNIKKLLFKFLNNRTN
jgi:hypothetical protein